MVSKVEHALALAARGFRVFPIAPNAKSPPLLRDWPARASSDPETVRMYWLAVPEANIGISCEGMLVVDVDVKKGGDESLQKLEILYGLPETRYTRTPTGGKHIFFRSDRPVANSVAVLGTGLDIRSDGGYVVAPGSVVPAGEYRAEVDGEIADAPEWLVQKLGTFTPREKTEKENVEDATDDVVLRAREWLSTQLPAIEGCGGDAHTFKVVCGLRDQGVSAAQAFDLIGAWNTLCAPPWSPEELGVKVDNAYRYAQNEPGAKAALPDDFPVITNSDKSEISQTVINRWHRLGSGGRNRVSYLIKGVLSLRSYAMVYGAPGSGKSFTALDMAYHVAAGLPWMGRKVRQGPVVYVPYEGTGGLWKREQAIRQRYGDKDVPFFVLPGVYNLREPKGAQAFGADIASIGETPVLYVFDTLAHALYGGDENSAQDVGSFNRSMQALIDKSGACVMVLHHSGKNKAAGARGSSAILGALDTELEVDSYQIKATKQRDVELGLPIGFKLSPIQVGMDEDDELITSCIVEPAQVVPVSNKKLRGNTLRAWQALCDMAPDNAPVTEQAWKSECTEFLAKRAGAFWDVRRALEKQGLIEVDEKGLISRRMG